MSESMGKWVSFTGRLILRINSLMLILSCAIVSNEKQEGGIRYLTADHCGSSQVYYSQISSCIECSSIIQNCTACSNSSTRTDSFYCQDCSQFYYLTTLNPPKNKTLNTAFTYPFRILVESACKPCQEGCTSCNLTQCSECVDNRSVSNSQDGCCPLNCIECQTSTICLECKSGWKLDAIEDQQVICCQDSQDKYVAKSRTALNHTLKGLIILTIILAVILIVTIIICIKTLDFGFREIFESFIHFKKHFSRTHGQSDPQFFTSLLQTRLRQSYSRRVA